MQNMQLSKIIFKAKKQVFSEQVGNHKSKQKGEGYDFCELRNYEIGDDIRHIDWMISAKIGKPIVKVFNKEHRLNIVSISLLGGSMHFGSKQLKQDLVAHVVAILGFSAIKNVDFFASAILSDELSHINKNSKNIASVYKAVQNIANFNPINKIIDMDKMYRQLEFRFKRKSLLFLIGDFFEVPDLAILAKKHEVVVIIVRDRLEEVPPKLGNSRLLDPANLKGFEGSIGTSLQNHYVEKIRDLDQELKAYFNRFKIRFVKLYTGEDPLRKLQQLMAY